MKNSRAVLIALGVIVFFGIFFLMPVADVMKQAFLDENGAFSIDYLWAVFSNPVYLEGLWNALALGVVSTVVTFLVALPLALASYRWAFPGKKWLSMLVLAPLVLPPFVGAVGVRQILGVEGALNAFLIDLGMMSAAQPFDWLGEGKFFGVVVMNALHLYPILYMNILAALGNLDPAMEQAAQNLGASPWKRFKKITLPLCMPGIFAGAAIVFIWAFTELGVPLVFDYNRVAPVQVYEGIKDLGSNPIPYALVAVMLTISVFVFVFSKLLLGRNKLSHSTKPKGSSSAKDLGGFRGWCVSVGFVAVFLIACIPHFGVLFLSTSTDWYGTILPESLTLAHYSDGLGHPLVVGSIRNSLFYATGATLLDLVLGVGIAWVVVRSKLWGRSLLDGLMMLPLAVPGLVLAFGYLSMSEGDGLFSFLVGANGNPAMLLIVAYGVRRLPFVVRAAVAGLEQSSVELEEAAHTVGASPSRAFWRIGLPLIGSSLIAGSILAFAFAMLEVSDSLILAQQVEHFPVTKAIYALLSTLGNGHEIASALGVWAMIFLGVAIGGAFVLVGRRGGSLFRF
ncbi:ABC transporter permease [Rubritalea spongiae]|uniref:ABC transporter permease n=1 Tax=Rubritalea spongiae TaxID=430797 RepID=A0ABW5E5Z4_9BACT